MGALLGSGAGPAEQGAGEWRIENSRWSRPLAGGAAVAIHNLHGDIRVRPSGDDQVELSATIQRQAEDPYGAEVAVRREEQRLVIEVVFSAATEDEGAWERFRRRVDLAVLVPDRSPLRLEVREGTIQARGLAGSVEATATSGEIWVSSVGAVRARTEHGQITVELRGDEWEVAPSLETVTGDIVVWLPSDADVEVRAETFGEISTDFSLEIERRAGSAKKYARATLGRGRQGLSVVSNRGRIKLLSLPS